MKKVLSFALALVMLLSLSIAVSAETYDTTGTYTTDVKASYVEGIEAGGTTYSITIEWTGMDSFVYNDVQNPVWDPENLEYSESVPASWEGEGTITVKNRSNTVISAAPMYKPAANYKDAHIVFDKVGAILADASVNKQEESTTFTATAIGALPECEDDTTIGTITLTITDCATIEEPSSMDVSNLKNLLAANRNHQFTVDSPENVSSGTYYIRAELEAAYESAMTIDGDNLSDPANKGIYTFCKPYGDPRFK